MTTKTAPVPQAVAVSPARSGPAIQPRFSMVPPATYPAVSCSVLRASGGGGTREKVGQESRPWR